MVVGYIAVEDSSGSEELTEKKMLVAWRSRADQWAEHAVTSQ
jgi:hypothetical protein